MMAKRKPVDEEPIDVSPSVVSPPVEAPASAPAEPDAAVVASEGPTVLIEARSGPYASAIDAGSRDGDRTVRIGGQRYEHVGEFEGRWVYRPS